MVARVGRIWNLAIVMLDALEKAGIDFDRSVQGLFNHTATSDDLRSSLEILYESWHYGNLSAEKLKFSFEVVQGFVMQDDQANRLKILADFLGSLPCLVNDESFEYQLVDEIDELKDEVMKIISS